MKAVLHASWIIVLILLAVGFIGLRPMSANFLHYLIWKYTTHVVVESGIIEHHGARIKYVAYGSGEPVLLLHGGLSNKLSWFSQLPWLVEAGRRVVLIDTRGHGDSTPGHAELNYQTFADDTLRVLALRGPESKAQASEGRVVPGSRSAGRFFDKKNCKASRNGVESCESQGFDPLVGSKPR